MHLYSRSCKVSGKQYGYGGYLEKQGIYRRSEVFAKAQEDFLNILLGNRPMDSWQLRFCTSDGAIHSFQDNVDFGNYGPMILLQHHVEGRALFSFYGHLQREDLRGMEAGQVIRIGDWFTSII